MIGKVDQVPDKNERKTAHRCPHDLIEQGKRFLPLRFYIQHLFYGSANSSVDQCEQDRNKEYIKHLLIHWFINELEFLYKIAHGMRNQETNDGLGYQHMVEPGRFPGSQGEVEKDIY